MTPSPIGDGEERLAVDLIDELRARGFIEQVTDEAGLRALLSAGPTAIYCGFDPTAPSLHCGSLVPLLALAHFQRAGHKVFPLMGGATGLIGDPSGKTELRKLLSADDVRANLSGIRSQLGRVLDIDKAEVVDNIDWFGPWDYLSFLRDIGRHFSVNRMLAATTYKDRYESSNGLNFIEFNYQLLQATDFLHLYEKKGCKVQIGGNDQWGNICAGVDLIRRKAGGEDAFGLTFPLLTTASGRKMGKTEKGAIWLDANQTSPHEFFQYWRDVQDEDVPKFLKLLTFVDLHEIDSLTSGEGKSLNAAKERLAFELTRMIHGQAAADQELAAARGDDEALPTVTIPRAEIEAGLGYLRAFSEVAAILDSNGEVRRAIQSGGIFVNEIKVSDVKGQLSLGDFDAEGFCLLRFGKKKKKRLQLGS